MERKILNKWNLHRWCVQYQNTSEEKKLIQFCCLLYFDKLCEEQLLHSIRFLDLN